MNLEQLKREVDKETYQRVRVETPELSIRIRGYFDRLGYPYKTVIENGWIVVTKGRI